MRGNHLLLLSGLLLFLAGVAGTLRLTGGESRPVLILVLLLFTGALVCFGVVTWRVLFRVDWDRIEAEQRLWESGPVGRAWLRIRRRLPGI